MLQSKEIIVRVKSLYHGSRMKFKYKHKQLQTMKSFFNLFGKDACKQMILVGKIISIFFAFPQIFNQKPK